jgi:hypothetical protein
MKDTQVCQGVHSEGGSHMMAKSTKKAPFQWKTKALVIFSHGGFSAILSLYPNFSPLAATFGLLFTGTAVAGSMLVKEEKNWWRAFIYYNSWLLIVLGIAARAWGSLIPPLGIWVIGLAALYALAWFIPSIAPTISRSLYESQIAPASRGGRLILALLLASAPSLAGSVALAGYYGIRFFSQNTNALVVGALSSFVSIGGCQAISQQMYESRPWADRDIGD